MCRLVDEDLFTTEGAPATPTEPPALIPHSLPPPIGYPALPYYIPPAEPLPPPLQFDDCSEAALVAPNVVAVGDSASLAVGSADALVVGESRKERRARLLSMKRTHVVHRKFAGKPVPRHVEPDPGRKFLWEEGIDQDNINQLNLLVPVASLTFDTVTLKQQQYPKYNGDKCVRLDRIHARSQHQCAPQSHAGHRERLAR